MVPTDSVGCRLGRPALAPLWRFPSLWIQTLPLCPQAPGLVITCCLQIPRLEQSLTIDPLLKWRLAIPLQMMGSNSADVFSWASPPHTPNPWAASKASEDTRCFLWLSLPPVVTRTAHPLKVYFVAVFHTVPQEVRLRVVTLPFSALPFCFSVMCILDSSSLSSPRIISLGHHCLCSPAHREESYCCSSDPQTHFHSVIYIYKKVLLQ